MKSFFFLSIISSDEIPIDPVDPSMEIIFLTRTFFIFFEMGQVQICKICDDQ